MKKNFFWRILLIATATLLAVIFFFPSTRLFSSMPEWWKKYTDYFGRKGDNSLAIAETQLKKYGKWEKEMDKWKAPVINNSKYLDWLKCPALIKLYYPLLAGIFYS